jgi:hypothetical protein
MSTIIVPIGSATGSPGLLRGFDHGAALDFRNAARDPDDHIRVDQSIATLDLADKVAQHALRLIEICNDSVLEWADRDDAAGGAAQHPLGLLADLFNRFALLVVCDHGWLAEENAATVDMDQGVCSPEIDANVSGEAAEERAK